MMRCLRIKWGEALVALFGSVITDAKRYRIMDKQNTSIVLFKESLLIAIDGDN